METIKITTNKQPNWYRPDWDRMTLNDIIRLLKALNPLFSDDHKDFNSIEDLLIKTDTSWGIE